ncbi:MAG: hypothetical protein RMA76_01360 [Deltaproteobacteria bacterium]|jgi:hypothetical protein
MRWWIALTSLVGFACGQNGIPADAIVRDGGPRTGACAYPDGAIEPMTEDQVIWPYRWASARALEDQAMTALDLEHAHCDTDDDMDWSPFDVLLFVSVPAW